MKTIAFYVVILLLITSCTSSKLVNEWKSPDAYNFEANKVLVVGITADTELRRTFESKVTEALEKKGVIAVKSVDFFEKSFTNQKQSEAQLDEIESDLLDAGFDAILFAKVTGQESRVSLSQSYRNMTGGNETFKGYYFANQYIYSNDSEEQYQVYHTETSIYCICPGKERELLWQGEIEIVDAERVRKNINDYIKILLDALEEEQLLIVDM
ncbi:MAG: hypothetical protein JKY22_11010 [Flavobacteriaceae bacterium]|nr:hypothetical protein [Flavobacteriaceae bacterium]